GLLRSLENRGTLVQAARRRHRSRSRTARGIPSCAGFYWCRWTDSNRRAFSLRGACCGEHTASSRSAKLQGRADAKNLRLTRPRYGIIEGGARSSPVVEVVAARSCSRQKLLWSHSESSQSTSPSRSSSRPLLQISQPGGMFPTSVQTEPSS